MSDPTIILVENEAERERFRKLYADTPERYRVYVNPEKINRHRILLCERDRKQISAKMYHRSILMQDNRLEQIWIDDASTPWYIWHVNDWSYYDKLKATELSPMWHTLQEKDWVISKLGSQLSQKLLKKYAPKES